MTQFDAVIIGAGQSGGPLATTLAKAGQKVAIIERKYVGGSCINIGCTPTKTMMASARVAHVARQAARHGVYTGDVKINLAEIRERKRKIVEQFRSKAEKSLTEIEGLELIRGEASFTGQKTLAITFENGETRNISAEKIFIDVGQRPLNPPIDGLNSVPVLHEDSIMELDEVPAHLLIVGGSYIGLEFAQMFCRFGSSVTVIERGDQLLDHEDEDIASAVLDVLRSEGINVLLKAEAKHVEKRNGSIRLTFKTEKGEKTLTGTHLLIGAGRVPNTDTLNLESAGIETDDKGYIKVNERLETNIPGVYAMGDVTGNPAFTHISFDDFRILRTNLLENGQRTTKDRPVPYVVFIDPPLGRVGMTEKDALEKGWNIKVAKIPMNRVARAIESGETQGLMKAVVNADTDEILGFAMLGIDADEVMGIVEMAIMSKLLYTVLRDGVFAHPTTSEALNNLFAEL